MSGKFRPSLLILNQMAGPMTWELVEDLGKEFGRVALLTGHPDTLAKGDTLEVKQYRAPSYNRGSMPFRSFSWVAYVLRAFLWLWRRPADVPVLLFSNPPILCWMGWLLKKLRGQRYAVMVHDIYPDVLVRVAGYSERQPLIRVWRYLNRHAYENAEVVMTLGEDMATNLEKQFDQVRTPAGKVEIVYPWVDTEKIKPIPKAENWFAKKYGQVDKLTVMYSGNLGLGHDIETMLAAVKALQNEPQIHFMFIGAGPKWNLVAETIEQEQLANATLLPWQPEETLPYSLACADVFLVSLEPGMQGLAVPSKAIYAMGAGASLLVFASGRNDLANWIEQLQLGEVVEADAQQVAGRLRALLRDGPYFDRMEDQVRGVAERVFSRRVNAAKFLAHLDWV